MRTKLLIACVFGLAIALGLQPGRPVMAPAPVRADDERGVDLPKGDPLLQAIQKRFLVETFSGKRNYYACVADTSSFQDRIRPIRTSYPQHSITVAAREDRAWKLYDGYRQDFPW